MTTLPPYEVLDPLRLTVSIFAAVVFLIGVLIPLRYTLISYKRKGISLGKYVPIRILFKLGLFFLTVHDMSFSLTRIFFPAFDRRWLVISAMVIYGSLAVLQVITWLVHPDGIKGV